MSRARHRLSDLDDDPHPVHDVIAQVRSRHRPPLPRPGVLERAEQGSTIPVYPGARRRKVVLHAWPVVDRDYPVTFSGDLPLNSRLGTCDAASLGRDPSLPAIPPAGSEGLNSAAADVGAPTPGVGLPRSTTVYTVSLDGLP